MRFRNFVLSNFPFLEDDFDALTDYQLFCKMLEYVKKMSLQFDDFQEKLNKYEEYFDNLDVQEEINNKLEEMYESGELATLVSEFLALKSTYTYNTVADMKLATELANGCSARTLGYNSLNDGGDAYYYIRTKNENDVSDDIFLIDLYDSTLIAELIIKNNTVNVKQAGLTGNVSDDATEILQYLVSKNYDLYFPGGTYNTNGKLTLACHKLIGEEVYNTTIKFTSENNDIFILANELNNIEYKNICFDCGLANDVTKHAITFFTVNKIKIINCEFKNGFGTHIRLNDSDDILIENCYFHDITGATGGMGNAIYCHPATNVTIRKCKCNYIRENFIYLDGEENKENKNILIENCFIQNTGYNNDEIVSHAIGINGKNINVTVINNVLINNGNGIRCDIRHDVTSENVYIGNNVIYNNLLNGIEIQATNVTLENNIIHDCSQDGIYIKNSKNINVNNNNVYDNTRYGIWFNKVDYISINNNRIYDNTTGGLALGRQESQACNYVTISNNEIYQTTDGTQTTGIQMLYCDNVKVLSCRSYGQTVNYDIYRSGVTNLVSQLNPTQGKSVTKSIMYDSEIPLTGKYNAGDIIYFTSPTAGGYIGAVCTLSGTPGTWKRFGSIES